MIHVHILCILNVSCVHDMSLSVLFKRYNDSFVASNATLCYLTVKVKYTTCDSLTIGINIFGHNREEVAGNGRRLHNEELRNV